jgi:hypothetical protein
MSYWKVASFAQPSPLEVSERTSKAVVLGRAAALFRPRLRSPLVPPPTKPTPQQILSKDSFTLEELLDEDDLIQECKSLNERLLRL